MDSTATSTGRVAERMQKVKEGKYLTFILENEYYGIEILTVQEIIGMMQVTRVPRTPEYVRGVINLRGKVIPLIDLRIKFGLQTCEDTKKTCIIVLQITRNGKKTILGIVVDEVSEVSNITGDNIQPPPDVGMSIDTSVIMGLGKIDERVIMLLDVDKIFTMEEIIAIQQQK